MNEQVLSVLVWAIESLETGLMDNPASLFDRVDTFTREESVALGVLARGHNEIFQRVSRAIYGGNVLTPSLTNKGWKIWRAPSVTPSEKEALLAAVSKYRNCVKSDIHGFKRGLESRMSTDPQQALVSFVHIQACIRQYIGDLRVVVELTP